MLTIPFFQRQDYPLKDGKPTSKGIARYLDDKGDSLIVEFQEFVDDTLYNVWIYADDLTEYSIDDSLELGRYYPYEIYITTNELFMAYALADLPESKRDKIEESNKFVKAVVMHELAHNYIHQIGIEMKSVDSIRVDRSFITQIWIIRSYETFGSVFIEEGICEYLTEKMGELIPPEIPFIPGTVEELIKSENEYKVKYKYSSHFLKTFLDTTGFKAGVKILLHNPPPTYEEILYPDLYFSRLELPGYSTR